MYLCNRDIHWAIRQGLLVVDPPPEAYGGGYDETSIDLHLDQTEKAARVWDVDALRTDGSAAGTTRPEVRLGTFDYKKFAGKYLKAVPQESGPKDERKVVARGTAVIVRPGGFLLWTTQEVVGTPESGPRYICFVNAKSTRARTGIVVHLSAPTIHAGWRGNITLEIANFGPFDLILHPGDAIAQLTVATISGTPDPELKKALSATIGQIDPSGKPT